MGYPLVKLNHYFYSNCDWPLYHLSALSILRLRFHFIPMKYEINTNLAPLKKFQQPIRSRLYSVPWNTYGNYPLNIQALNNYHLWIGYLQWVSPFVVSAHSNDLEFVKLVPFCLSKLENQLLVDSKCFNSRKTRDFDYSFRYNNIIASAGGLQFSAWQCFVFYYTFSWLHCLVVTLALVEKVRAKAFSIVAWNVE